MLEDILVPLGVCVVMPVMIVWLVFRSRNHTLDRKTEVMIKAIENGQEVDPSLFSSVSADAKASKTLKMQLMSKLQGGIITLLIGLTLLVVGLCGIDAAATGKWLTGVVCGGVLIAVGIAMIIMFVVGKKWMASEIEAEEKSVSGKE